MTPSPTLFLLSAFYMFSTLATANDIAASAPSRPPCTSEEPPGLRTARIAGGIGVTALGTGLLAGALAISMDNAHRDAEPIRDETSRDLARAAHGSLYVSGVALMAVGIYALATPSLLRASPPPACQAGIGPGAWLWPSDGRR